MMTTGVASAASLFNDDFEDGNLAGWTTSGGSWSVVPDGSRVLAQTGTSADARARAGSASWANYTVTVRVKPVAFNGTDRFVAVLARAQSATSYYYLALRNSNRLELKKLVNGSATTLASTALSVTPGTWYSLSLSVSGSSLAGRVNGGTSLTATDTRFSAGQVGVATFHASARFDDVVVEEAPLSTPTPGSPTLGSPSPSASTSGSPSPSASTPTPPVTNMADGFAGVNALGQNGTTGGAGGRTVTATTTEEFLRYIDSTERLIIQLAGRVSFSSKKGVRPNKTIVGVGSTAQIDGGGLDFYRSYNVIVRNILFTNADDDAVNVGQNSHHIWIDHNTFRSPIDGAIDIVREADYVTVSWNHFDHSDKTMLIGHSDSASSDIGHLKVSIHHNWFDNTQQRHPRVRFAEPVHIYNNYYLNNALYGVASTMNGGVLVEGNYFENVPHPMYSTSGYADSGPGRAVARDNIYVNSGPPETNGTVIEPRTYYSYTLDDPSSVPAAVRAGAGTGRL